MNQNSSWYNADRVSQSGSVVLNQWIGQREGAAARAGMPVVNNDTTMLLSDPRVVEFFGVQTSASGVVVNATTAMRVSTVYACVGKIAGGISTMPIRVYERIWDGSQYQRRQVDDVDLWWLLNESPTAAFTAASHWELGAESLLLRGAGYTEIKRSASGRTNELVPHLWEAITPRQQKDGRLAYAVMDGYNARGLDQDDMLHFAGAGFNGLSSPSVISAAARQAVGNALAMDEFSGKVFSGGAHHSMVLETDNKMKPDQVEILQRTYREKHSGLPNAHTTPLVLTEGLKARAVTMSAADVQLLEAKRFQVIDICRAFGVPPHMVGETSASTSWGSGIEAMSQGFVRYTLQPHLARIEQELNRKLFRTAKYFLAFDREELQAGDTAAQANSDKAGLGGPGAGPGWISVNEVRRRRNLPPLADPKYDQPYWPPANASGGAKPDRPDPEPPDPNNPDPRRRGET